MTDSPCATWCHAAGGVSTGSHILELTAGQVRWNDWFSRTSLKSGLMFAYKLNLLHAVVLPSALACLYFAVWESRRRTLRLRRLFWSPWLSLLAALLLVFMEARMKQPVWPFWAALGGGLIVGGARSLVMKLEVDKYWLVVRPAGGRTIIWVATLMVTAAIVDIAGAAIGPEGNTWRYYATMAAAACSGLLFGRALAMAVRVWRLIG